MNDGLSLELPAAAIEQLVSQVVERVKADLADVSPWLTRQQAAGYLSIPISRLEKDRAVPVHRWDGRVLYNRIELDAWISSL